MQTRSTEEPNRTYCERLAASYSGAVYDVMRNLGLPAMVLPRSIRGIAPGIRLAGPIFTLRGRQDSCVSPHESLTAWTEFLALATPGHVVVCQPQDDVRAVMGELSAETLKHRGVRGYIVDGGTRDSALIEQIGFPVFCRYRTPIDIVAAWLPEACNEPITIGNVLIHPSDWVLADDDGIVVIPSCHFEDVLIGVEKGRRSRPEAAQVGLGHHRRGASADARQ